MNLMQEFYQRVYTAISSGVPLTVEMLPALDDLGQEGVIDPGMRAKIVGIHCEDGHKNAPAVYKITFDMTDFLDYNLPFEQANWFVGPGPELDTARNTGNWPSNNQDDIWLGEDEVPHNFFKMLEGGPKLYDEYRASGFQGSYTSWLEAQLEEADNALSGLNRTERRQLARAPASSEQRTARRTMAIGGIERLDDPLRR